MKFLRPRNNIVPHKTRVYFDLETCPSARKRKAGEPGGLAPFQGDQILGVAIGVTNKEGNKFTSAYYPLRHPSGNLSPKHRKQLMTHLMDLNRQGVIWVMHNARFDLHFMRVLRSTFGKRGQFWCTLMAAHIADENRPSFRLKDLGEAYFGPGAIEAEAALTQAAKKDRMYTLPVSLVAPYARMDVELTWKLDRKVRKELRAQNLTGYATRQMNIIDVVERMERTGVGLDIDMVNDYSSEALRRAKYYKARIRTITGDKEFNPNSSKQVNAFTGWKSTSADVVTEKLFKNQVPEEIIPFVKTLLKFRGWNKVQSTYYKNLLLLADDNNRIHPGLNPNGTVSGRFSSSKPNFQNLPRRGFAKDTPYKVRDVIVPAEGNALVRVDYSQAELRIASHFAEEETMLGLFEAGVDPHTWVAEEVFGVDRNHPHFSEYRHVAKTINFGIIYGMGVNGLASNAQLRTLEHVIFTHTEASKFLYMYKKRFPKFEWLFREAMKMAKERGYIYLYTNRRRRFPDPREEPWAYLKGNGGTEHKRRAMRVYQTKLRSAVNNLVQGTVAEIMNDTLLNVDKYLTRNKIKPGLMLQIHDEFIIECPIAQVPKIVPDLVAIAENDDFDVFMPVDVNVGFSWGGKMSYQKFLSEVGLDG